MCHKIDENYVIYQYRKMTNRAKYYFHKNCYEKALRMIFFACGFMYTMNQQLYDDELEILVQKMGGKIVGTIDYEPRPKTVIIYDALGNLNRGLAGIYMTALKELGYSLHYLTFESYIQDDYSNVLYIKGNTLEEQIRSCRGIVDDLRAELCFILPTPDDVIGVAVLSNCNCLKRYMINITDHAFWLGRNMFDYVINFREFGVKVCSDLRHIEHSRILYLPYYPMKIDTCKSKVLEDIPVQAKVIFSGGAEYKTISKNNYYYVMIDYILSNFENAIFIYYGKSNYSRNWRMLLKKYKNRIIVDFERNDFYEIMKRCLFYFSTYPYNGGLMTQYALAANKVPVTLCGEQIEAELSIHHAESFWNFQTIEECKQEINRLFQDDAYRKSNESKLHKFLISQKVFKSELEYLLKTNKSFRNLTLENYQIKGFFSYPLEYYTGLRFYRLFFRKNGRLLAELFPGKYVLGLVATINDKVKAWRRK
jgi:hypothetical protein